MADWQPSWLTWVTPFCFINFMLFWSDQCYWTGPVLHREREREKEKKGERNIDWLPPHRSLNQGSNQQSRYVSWSGIELAVSVCEMTFQPTELPRQGRSGFILQTSYIWLNGRWLISYICSCIQAVKLCGLNWHIWREMGTYTGVFVWRNRILKGMYLNSLFR